MAAVGKKQVMDVARPGQTAAAPTARPLIIGHGAVIKDPTIQQPSSAEPIVETATPESISTGEKVIAPLTDSQKASTEPTEKTPQTAPEDAPAPAEAEKHAEASEATPEKEPQKDPDAAPADAEDAVVEAVLEQSTKKKDKDKLAEEQKRQELVQQLADDKTYFLPIHQKDAGSRASVVVLWLVVVPALVGGAVYAYKMGWITLLF